MSKKKNSVFSSLILEKKRLESRIKRLLKEKETISEKMEYINLGKIVDDLKHEKAELEERIERLEGEKTDVMQHIEVTEIIGGLKCPKNYRCYRRKYKELCKAEFVPFERSVVRGFLRAGVRCQNCKPYNFTTRRARVRFR